MSERRSGWQIAATIIAIPAAVVVLAGIAIIVTFFTSVQDKSGDDIALKRVENVARALADDLGGARDLTDAETAAAEMFHSRSATVVPLTWTGTLGTEGGITIEARITADVAGGNSGAMFAPDTSSGFASRCYRYTVAALRDVRYWEIPCAFVGEPSAPPMSTRPELPLDAAERVEDALRASADTTELSESLHREFPGERFRVETEDTPAGERVVAVGVTPGTDCVLRVRLTDGEIVTPSYDQIWLQPGELGCSTRLYTAPPQ